MKDARRLKLNQLRTFATRAISAKDARTRRKNTKLLQAALTKLQESQLPTDREILILMRAACIVVGVRGGLACDPLPGDATDVVQVLEQAILSLGPVRLGRLNAVVHPWVIHAAAAEFGAENALTRNALEAVCNRELEPGEAAERAASRVLESGDYVETPLGRVAGIIPKPEKG